MKLGDRADIYQTTRRDFSQTTHLGVGAHQDDLEIMATHGIVEAFNSDKKWFSGVVVTNGAGSVLTGEQQSLKRREVMEIRRKEQISAAEMGHYLTVIQLGYESKDIKSNQFALVDDLKEIVKATRPEVIYTHNPTDKHLTHLGVFVHLLQALREINYRPQKFFGCEVWRALDWLPDDRKVALPINSDDNFVTQLISCHKSQSSQGKNFHLATLGRMKANAAYYESHQENTADKLWFAMDLMPLLDHPQLSATDFIDQCMNNFANEVRENLSHWA